MKTKEQISENEKIKELQNLLNKKNKELEIEAALERVRARTMGMHKSDELAETASVTFQQLKRLDVVTDEDRFAFGILDVSKGAHTLWITEPGGTEITRNFKLPIDTKKSLFAERYKKWQDTPILKRKELVFKKEYSGQALLDYISYLAKHTDLADDSTLQYLKKSDNSKVSRYTTDAYFAHGVLQIIGPHEVNDEQLKILQRFAKVFEQTYTRFLDLKKAEDQAREAQIEAALEKIRTRSTAMQKSSELIDIVTMVFQQLTKLKFKTDASLILLNNYPDKDFHMWIATKNKWYAQQMDVPYFKHPVFDRFIDAVKKGKDFYSDTLTFEQKNSFFRKAFRNSDFKLMPEERKKYILKSRGWSRSAAISKNSSISIQNYQGVPYSEEEHKILKRFAKVFEQSYTRFLDLQKAEAQARQAQIETALEKVRARTMAMHQSEELAGTATMVFGELKKLGAVGDFDRFAFGIFNTSNHTTTLWSTERGGTKISRSFDIPILPDSRFKPFERSYTNWLNTPPDKRKERDVEVIVFSGDDFSRLMEYYLTYSDLIDDKTIQQLRKLPPDKAKRVYHFATFNSGALYIIGPESLGEDTLDLLKRFAGVFEQTYTRFLDLKKAEEQAREAVKQASLDRVRGEIASMRTSEDLNRITPVIWRELQALEVPFFRCGVFIADEENKKVRVYLSTPDGKALAALNLNIDATRLTTKAIDFWRKKQVYTEHWNKKDFINWTESMMNLGQVESAEKYQNAARAPESLDLHLIPFMQGMLYVGNTSPLSNDELELVKSLANTFSIAYARYEDFSKLENAKEKVEKTLIELKAAQSQLIQSEKMASLGELTAGIAHEIQNPLNFVKNFSELTTELLKELEEERAKGNMGVVDEITRDILENLNKITLHGNRASSIVQGMLLHSRGGDNEKEPTDLNKLANEYLRLSYHGFRAKDKSFNADFKLELDESLPKIQVVPQDIGRVLLNLINNAFYVVNEKAKSEIEGYKPEVVVSISSSPFGEGGSRGVKISVKDNGNGIPDSIKNKIFQPFFTTKSTGEGTGLGLSLSYDIVKAHAGEIKLETKDGKGTEFKILLPFKS